MDGEVGMEKLIEVKNLTKMFSIGTLLVKTKIAAVEEVSFYIKSAEIFTLAGESGCGKTTTAKIILGFEEQTAGEIFFERKPMTFWKRKRLQFLQKVQAVFQNPFESFNQLRTVDDIFFETVYNYKMAQGRNRATELIDDRLKSVGLSFQEINGRYPGELSGGQLQRASIARALITNPTLLVTDEPVSMVDASLRMSIVNLFAQLRDKMQLSILYITHDLATAYYLSDRIAIMFRGNIVEMGSLEEVLGKPKHPYTQLLRNSIPEADPRKKWKGEIAIFDSEYEEYLRQGCKFAGRCPVVMGKCKKEIPREVLVDGVLVKCHQYENKVK
jgi:peptide/nickel transport system ATP-binding protein